MRYRKKPVVIDAFQLNSRGLVSADWFWDAVTRNDIITHHFGKHDPEDALCEIKTLEGTMIAGTGDYIIQGVAGEIYPCKPDIFEKTYEMAEAEPDTNEWTSVKDRLPEKQGRYLCVINGIVRDDYVSICSFTKNLHKFDEFDFPNENRPGWYNYDGEHGYYEVGGVKYWMPLPEMPEV